jgi:hypothetical protein
VSYKDDLQAEAARLDQPTTGNIEELEERIVAAGGTLPEREANMADDDEPSAKPDDRPASSVASPAENAELEHSRGGSTTRDDNLDAGVPMEQGEKGTRQPVGPEDALGHEATRGDYTDRIDQGPHLQTESVEDPGYDERWVNRETGEAASEGDEGAYLVREPRPRQRLVEQTPATPSG